MEELSLRRLQKEWQFWKMHRIPGFTARLSETSTGTRDYYNWECLIPGPEGSLWEGGTYKLFIKFPEDFPVTPPKCIFEKKLFHPNVYKSGTVCLNIINEDEQWRAGTKITEILAAIKELLAHPNTKSPANEEAQECYEKRREEYKKRVRE